MIRDRLVIGTNDSRIREKLINEGEKLTLYKALQLAQSFEYCQKQMASMNIQSPQNLASSSASSSPVDAILKQTEQTTTTTTTTTSSTTATANAIPPTAAAATPTTIVWQLWQVPRIKQI
jgi:plasmid maintenance system antidote protein VapI